MLNRQHSGFSLLELLVAITVMAVMMALAVPSFTTWIRNARIRAVTDALQSGLRLSQAEAQRRSHTVAFFLTNSKNCAMADTAIVGGNYWQVRTVPNALLTGDTAEIVQCGVLTDVSSTVRLTSATAVLCFGGDGRQTTATNPAAIGLDCTAAAALYDVTASTSRTEDRPLRVTVSLAGGIRLCDPGKSASTPEGCR